MATKVSDAEILHAWSETQSPTQIAKAFGLTMRATQARLRGLGVPPLPNGGGNKPAPTKSFIREARGRLDVSVSDGTVLVFSDAHYWPDEKTTAHRALLKLCKELKPKVVIANGDIFDGGGISRFGRSRWEQKPSVAQELKAVFQRLGEIEKASPQAKRLWTIGNHDARFETQLSNHAAGFEGVKGFSLTDHVIGWEPCWAVWINDNVVVKHRFRGGIHATHNNTVHAGCTIVTGHLHSLKVTPFSDYGGTRWGVDTGTLCDPYADQFSYGELSPVNHRSGFAVLTFTEGRLLWPELCHVIEEGVAEFRGKVYQV
jgi:hypothetical protein